MEPEKICEENTRPAEETVNGIPSAASSPMPDNIGCIDCESESAKKKKRLRYLAIPFVIIVYILIGLTVSFFTARSGTYPAGSDTMFYVYRGDLIYQTATQEHNLYPLLDPAWYNGVQTLRYWSPLSAWILAGTQAISGGSPFDGYIVFVGLMYFFCAIQWLWIGYRHNRPVLGSVIGLFWFFVPNNLFMLYGEGVLARAISMTVLPIFITAIHDYLKDGYWKRLITIILSFIFIVMCHTGWAGMILITMMIFFLFYYVINNKNLRGEHRILNIVIAAVLAFAICGIWLYASLNGGITDLDSSSIMANFFQPIGKSINPVYGLKDGYLNRWLNPAVKLAPYFGFAAFIIGIIGIFMSKRESAPGFMTAICVCLMTTSTAYPILVLLPGSQYLWMLRFFSIALTFLFVALFFWKTLKKQLVIVFTAFLAIEAMLSVPLMTGNGTWVKPQERYEIIEEDNYIDIGKELADQRFSCVEPYGSICEGVYVMAGFGENRLPNSYGQGVQAASTYANIVQINEAAEQKLFLYMFDRCLELGNDALILPIGNYNEVNEKEILSAARRVGYQMVESDSSRTLYRLDPEYMNKNGEINKSFGHISKYRCIAIGKTSRSVALDFPATEETVDPCINHYTFDELSKYDIVFLVGFTFTDKAEAEDLIIKLSENGTRIIIMADGIPEDEHTGSKAFLGMECYPITFRNGYPELETIDGILNCDFFPREYSEWKTVYINGLDDVWGYVTDLEQLLPFYGTVKNDNIVVIGLNLSYHYALTKDPTVGALLSHAYSVNTYELPSREIVPLEINYYSDRIEVYSDYDDVCTTIAWQDIFNADNGAYTKNNLAYVNKGKTIIKLSYPYFWQGIAVSIAGLIASAIFIANSRRRYNKLHPKPSSENIDSVNEENVSESEKEGLKAGSSDMEAMKIEKALG